MVPFHTWLLNAHVDAPTAGSIVLAAIMLKLGAFGFIRYSFGLFHDVCLEMAYVVACFAIISIVYSSFCSITEKDAKRLIAHTSIAHMNFVVFGLFSFDPKGFFGAIYLIIGHAVTSTALFYLIGILYDRTHARELDGFGGLVQLMPLFSSALFFFALANAGFPWSLSFLGEYFILFGIAKSYSLLAFAVIIVCSVLLLYSNLRLFTSICYGNINKNLISNSLSDLTHLEMHAVALLVLNALCLLIGNDFYFYLLHHDLMLRYIY